MLVCLCVSVPQDNKKKALAAPVFTGDGSFLSGPAETRTTGEFKFQMWPSD